MEPNILTIDQFEFLIHQFGLKPEYHLTLDGDDILVNEEWKSESKREVTANRIYKFSSDFLDVIKESDREFVLNQVLDLHLKNENYEQCVVIRDILKDIKFTTLEN